MIVVVLGGARSGKSEVAERRITALTGPDPVTYVATARPDSGSAASVTGDSDAVASGGSGGLGSADGAGRRDIGGSGDPAWVERIERHRDRRPPHWTTVDAGDDLPVQLIEICGPVLLDSLGPWVAAQMEGGLDLAALVAALVDRRGDTVVVSDEVGLSVHPPTAAGRQFVDALGTVNRAVVGVADEAWLVVAGRVVALEPEPAWPVDGPR